MTKQSPEQKTIRILYHGPGVVGKTTNLLYLHKYLTYENKGELQSELLRDTDRHIFFTSNPPEMMMERHVMRQLRIGCIPGAVWYKESREDLLQEADAVVFVADSQHGRFEANQEILEQMEHVLHQRGESLQTFPWVLQYNKRDLPNIGSIQEMERQLNPFHVPSWSAIASQGTGVIETFHGIIHRIITSNSAQDEQ